MIIFARHGMTKLNEAAVLHSGNGSGISNKGTYQARALAEWARGHNISRLYTSELKRAIETAEIVAAKLNVEFEVHELLRERDYGPFENLRRPDLLASREERGLSNIDPTQDWYGVREVESDELVFGRVRGFFDETGALRSSGAVLIVTHAGVIKSFLHTVYRIPPGCYRCFKITNGSALRFRLVSDFFEMLEFWPNPIG